MKNESKLSIILTWIWDFIFDFQIDLLSCVFEEGDDLGVGEGVRFDAIHRQDVIADTKGVGAVGGGSWAQVSHSRAVTFIHATWEQKEMLKTCSYSVVNLRRSW